MPLDVKIRKAGSASGYQQRGEGSDRGVGRPRRYDSRQVLTLMIDRVKFHVGALQRSDHEARVFNPAFIVVRAVGQAVCKKADDPDERYGDGKNCSG